MTKRRSDLHLPARTPSFVSREIGAAELCISPDTWDALVRRGVLPRPVMIGDNPRWRWDHVVAALDAAGRDAAPSDPFTAGLGNGQTQRRGRGRDAA